MSCRPALSQTVLKAWLLRQLMVVWRKEWRREIEEMMTLSLMAARCERDGWGRLGSFSVSLLLINWWSTSTALSGADANKSEACESNISKECSGLDKKTQTIHILVWLLSDGTDTSFIWLLLTLFSLSLFIFFSFSFFCLFCFLLCLLVWMNRLFWEKLFLSSNQWLVRNCRMFYMYVCVWSMWIWCIVSCDDCYWMRNVFLISFEI